MKTAHDNLELFDLRTLTSYDKWIQAIEAVQLDAYRAGMAEAAEIVRTSGDVVEHFDYAAKSILAVRDKKETL